MRSELHHVDGATVLTIAGDVRTPATAVELEYLLAHLPDLETLVLDLAEVTALGTAGLSVLARAAARTEHGLVIVIGEQHDVVLRAVESAHLLSSVRLFDTLEHALRAAAPRS